MNKKQGRRRAGRAVGRGTGGPRARATRSALPHGLASHRKQRGTLICELKVGLCLCGGGMV
jgi:hypothetical protein